MKKLLASLLSAVMLVGVLAACGGDTSSSSAAAGSSGSTGSSTSGSTAPSGDRTTVVFWYNNTGDEALVYEAAIKAYNESQDKYTVEGLSVSDRQKLIVAMSSNESPDVIKESNQYIVQYQTNGLLESLKSYIDAESFDTSSYSPSSLEANTVDGELYALPLSAYIIQMFYNKDLLEAAGYTEPPKTMEEMYEMAVAATVVDANGNFEVLGYPLFPYASARQELVYGFGGRWWDDEGNFTPNTEGTLTSLKMNVQYRELYGKDAVNNFIGTANTNRYSEQDMFFQGKQLFRLDGSWLPTMMENFNSTVNWGLAPVPGTEANPELIGTSRYETDSIGIPTTAKEKDGAWDFTKWLCGVEGAKIIDLGTGNLPALTSLYDDPDVQAKPGFADFIEILKEEKGIQYARSGDLGEYWSLINAMLDEVYAGTTTPEAALESLVGQASGLS